MKKNVFLLMGIALMLTACEKQVTDDMLDVTSDGQSLAVTFRVDGDFERPTFGDITRAAVTADGKAMTDIYVLDYIDGVLVQQVHQTAEDEDFGEPTVMLDYGQHHVYFVCCRGKTPTLSTANHSIVWASPSDTFYKDYSVTVSGGTNTAHNVTLNRVATKLSITINDELPEGLACVELTPATWYYGIDYLTGLPTDAQADEPLAINIPTSYIGRTTTTLSIFSLSTAAEWTTDIAITARDGDDDIIGQAGITAAPFKANRATSYAGNLFGSSSGFALSLNTAWDEEHTASW